MDVPTVLPKAPIVLDNEAKFIDSSARDLKTFVARSLIPRHEGTVHEAENSGLLSVRWNGDKRVYEEVRWEEAFGILDAGILDVQLIFPK